MESKEVKHYLAVSADEYRNATNIIQETFKGEVNNNEIKYPKGIGVNHPFEFEDIDKIVNNIGIINAVVDKIVDAIIGNFSVVVDNPNGQKIIDSFIDNSNFKTQIRPWVKEAVSKGNGIMELDLDNNQLRPLNANHMYLKRTKSGKILEWNQWKGRLNKIDATFKPNQIAHLVINQCPGEAYGNGLIYPNRVSIENYAWSEISTYKLLGRKAGAPIHVQIGQPGESVQSGDIDDFKSKLQFMNNSTEWVTDGNIKMSLIDFSGVGDNLTNASKHALEQIAIGMKIPMSLLGIANIPEGLAKENTKDFKRFIHSVRTQIEEIIEDNIFEVVLRNNGLDFKVEFKWEEQDAEEKNNHIKVITDALKMFDMSPELKAGLEIELAKSLELDDVIKFLVMPKDAKKKADEEIKKQEAEIQQPEVPGVKPTAKESDVQTISENEELKSQEVKPKIKLTDAECHHECNLTEEQLSEMTIGQYVNLKEIAGFNYSDYLVKILQALKIYKFQDLRAITEQDLIEGLLPGRDIEKLRIILKDGFRKNRTINQITKDIKNSIDLKDRIKIEEDGTKKVTLSASQRPVAIARTETVKLANEGLKNMYIENDITSYRYLAAIDDRTSDICQELNGQVFLTKDGTPGVNMPPMHVNCRSSIIGLVE